MRKKMDHEKISLYLPIKAISFLDKKAGELEKKVLFSVGRNQLVTQITTYLEMMDKAGLNPMEELRRLAEQAKTEPSQPPTETPPQEEIAG